MRFLFERMKLVVEPSGAVSVAAMIKYCKHNQDIIQGKKMGAIISGGNIDMSIFFSYLEKLIVT
jgi:threonine dehydratase